MSEVVQHINENDATLQVLDSLFNEAEPHGCRNLLEGLWVHDTSNVSERAQFLEDQLTNSKCYKIM